MSGSPNSLGPIELTLPNTLLDRQTDRQTDETVEVLTDCTGTHGIDTAKHSYTDRQTYSALAAVFLGVDAL